MARLAWDGSTTKDRLTKLWRSTTASVTFPSHPPPSCRPSLGGGSRTPRRRMGAAGEIGHGLPRPILRIGLRFPEDRVSRHLALALANSTACRELLPAAVGEDSESALIEEKLESIDSAVAGQPCEAVRVTGVGCTVRTSKSRRVACLRCMPIRRERGNKVKRV